MQSRDNHLDRSTAPGFRVLAQPSRSPTPLQQSRPDTVLPPIFLSRCVTKSTHVPFARRSLDGLDHSIPIERLAEGLLQIAVSRTPRPPSTLFRLRSSLRRGAHDTALRISRQLSCDCSLCPSRRHQWPTSCCPTIQEVDRKSTRLNSSHANISYAVFCLKEKKKNNKTYEKPAQTSHRRRRRSATQYT